MTTRCFQRSALQDLTLTTKLNKIQSTGLIRWTLQRTNRKYSSYKKEVIQKYDLLNW